jgi:hypothetical protein
VETEVLVETLSSNLVSLVKIDNLPSLGGSLVLGPDLNWVSFFVFASSNIKYHVVSWISEVFTTELEDLEPSGVGAPDLHVLGLT